MRDLEADVEGLRLFAASSLEMMVAQASSNSLSCCPYLSGRTWCRGMPVLQQRCRLQHA